VFRPCAVTALMDEAGVFAAGSRRAWDGGPRRGAAGRWTAHGTRRTVGCRLGRGLHDEGVRGGNGERPERFDFF